jgi:hypothetical protein
MVILFIQGHSKLLFLLFGWFIKRYPSVWVVKLSGAWDGTRFLIGVVSWNFLGCGGAPLGE